MLLEYIGAHPEVDVHHNGEPVPGLEDVPANEPVNIEDRELAANLLEQSVWRKYEDPEKRAKREEREARAAERAEAKREKEEAAEKKKAEEEATTGAPSAPTSATNGDK